jgi:hypothetical protein
MAAMVPEVWAGTSHFLARKKGKIPIVIPKTFLSCPENRHLAP